jgi:hypothetical protein
MGRVSQKIRVQFEEIDCFKFKLVILVIEVKQTRNQKKKRIYLES